ncbi:hypothetical protein [Thermomonas sp.]|uniref:hypothetical protein n=1 Tax=Thermomonas sp. TaxID=1971895 RepID=UPI002629508C|nr:hypothetical protein [Thermomonas sp.]MCO5056136.1 DUF1631 domain-containing protein [Thermomonas sp.]
MVSIDASRLPARWLGEDDLDPRGWGCWQRAVNSVQRDGNGGPEAFAEANCTLQSGLQTLMRKAERWPNAGRWKARGRERFAIARMRAGEEITRLLGWANAAAVPRRVRPSRLGRRAVAGLPAQRR